MVRGAHSAPGGHTLVHQTLEPPHFPGAGAKNLVIEGLGGGRLRRWLATSLPGTGTGGAWPLEQRMIWIRDEASQSGERPVR